MRIFIKARFAALPLAASLFLGGCFLSTSENENAADSKQTSTLAASISVPWSLMPQTASEIGVGPENSVFMLALASETNGSHKLYKWNGSSWLATTRSGFQLDVGGNGQPYIIGSDKKVYRGNTSGTSWSTLNGITATEIGVGANGDVWAIGAVKIPGTNDYSIHKWNGSGWNTAGGGAVRVDVGPDGTPWVINANNELYEGNADGTSWMQRGSAVFTDFSVGPDNSKWALDNVIVARNGDKRILRHTILYTFSPAAWEQANGGAKRISVGSNGVVWIVNHYGAIYEGRF